MSGTPAVGGPIVGVPANAKPSGFQRTALDDNADIRDSIGILVGSGLTKRGVNKEVDAHATRILKMLGPAAGQKLLTHIKVYNSRPDLAGQNPTQRLTRFYDIQSGDPGVQGLISKAKAFGTGPIAAYSETPDITAQQFAGAPATPVVVRK